MSEGDANLQLFARSLAHDFNNLITGIMGHAALIEAIGSEDPDIADSATIIRKTAERAAELNAQLMDLSRMGEARAVPVDVHDTIREVASLVGPTSGGRIRIHLDLRAPRHHITADPGQVHQILLNLAVNARDAMPRGGQLLFGTETSGGQIAVRVADTGDGIPIELQSRIFEPMFTTKPAGLGSGLGLAVVKRVMEQHGGAIELRSAPGFGATFLLRFRLCEPAAAVASRAFSAAAGA